MKCLVMFLCVVLSFTYSVTAQKVIKANRAYKHIGEIVTVCDTVCGGVNSSYAQLFELYLGQDVAYKRLTVNLLPAVFYNLQSIKNKLICVTGLLEGTREYPIITVKDTSQIRY